MKWGFLTALSGGILMQLLIVGFLAYVAGHSGAVSLIGANCFGVLAGICAAVAIFYTFGIRQIGKSQFWLVITVLAVGFLSRPLVISMFASGFKKRALQQASVKEWESLRSIADRLISLESKDRASVLPKFVGSVFPGRTPHFAVTGESLEETSMSLSVWWRNSGVCVGFDIGKNQPSRSRLLFRQTVSEEMVLVVFRDS